jgi:endonuclease/exonuclease/phosphatase family metal-dependent hydrolase
MTFNVWGKELWPSRRESLSAVIGNIKPDIMLLQEISTDILECLDDTLKGHDRVHDIGEVVGWETESQIYWRRDMFTLVGYGFKSYENEEVPNRGLFWARLRSTYDPDIVIFVSTTHLPWTGCSAELSTGFNQRILALHHVIKHLEELVVSTDLASFIGGDFNEDFHPIRMLNNINYFDVFQLFDVYAPITHPVRPSCPQEERRPQRTLDWIACKMPVSCRVMSATAKTIRGGSFPPPSDHLPVIAILELSY